MTRSLFRARLAEAAVCRPWPTSRNFAMASAIPAPHSKIPASSNSERFALSLFDRLWEQYRSRVSYVNVYEVDAAVCACNACALALNVTADCKSHLILRDRAAYRCKPWRDVLQRSHSPEIVRTAGCCAGLPVADLNWHADRLLSLSMHGMPSLDEIHMGQMVALDSLTLAIPVW